MIGGGIAGAATAHHLVRAGVDALLVDRGDEGRATDAGAGILSPATSSRTGSDPWFEYAVRAVGYYDELAADLAAIGYEDHGYASATYLQVAVDPAEREVFEERLGRLRERQARLGVPREGSLAELDGDAARDLFPPLGDVDRALRYDDAGRVDGRAFTDALLGGARDEGLETRDGDARGIVVEDGTVEAVVVDGERVPTDSVVVAGGAWSAAFGDDLGVAIPVHPMRGQIVHLDVDAETADWPIVGGFRHHYAVPWPGGRVAAGATREPEAGFRPRPTAEGVRTVLDEALRVAPGLGDAELADVRVGLRPATEDGLPVLGAVPGVDGAYLNTGHGPTGLMLGPYSGRQVARLVRGLDPEADLAPFSVDRFRASAASSG